VVVFADNQVQMTLARGEAVAWVQRLRGRGLQIVFTNGVFDLLHPGHVCYLQEARRLGDALIVGLNSDRSVRALAKGLDRPLNAEAERAEVLAALACVDAVTTFDDDTPHEIVTALQPDILVKGADWGPDNIVGRDIVEARGGKVVRIPIVAGYSTTELIAKIQGRPVGQ
jgi:D-glycero-beta-D-manno-heptose 1-phosphate adenylyltransferase